jgi:hypothetical protein
MQSTLMLILFLVVVFVPGILLLGLGSVGTGVDRPSEGPDSRTRAYPQSGELPEILRRPLRARL